MQIIEFEVPEIGKFKAKASLTIIEENELENRIDEQLDGQYYELKARALDLEHKNYEDIANQIHFQIYVARIMATLEKVLIELPDTIQAVETIEDYDSLFAIYDQYKKKQNPRQNPSKKESTKSSNSSI